MTIAEFIRAIKRLPEDLRVENPRVWYRSQHEHWLGWLGQYHTPGAYGRTVDRTRDARYAYNHAVNPQLLHYLAHVLPIDPAVTAAVDQAFESPGSMMAISGAIRKIMPWEMLYPHLAPRAVRPPGLFKKLKPFITNG